MTSVLSSRHYGDNNNLFQELPVVVDEYVMGIVQELNCWIFPLITPNDAKKAIPVCLDDSPVEDLFAKLFESEVGICLISPSCINEKEDAQVMPVCTALEFDVSFPCETLPSGFHELVSTLRSDKV